LVRLVDFGPRPACKSYLSSAGTQEHPHPFGFSKFPAKAYFTWKNFGRAGKYGRALFVRAFSQGLVLVIPDSRYQQLRPKDSLVKSITLADPRNRFADVSTAIRHRGKLLITMWGVPIASLSPVLSVVIPAGTRRVVSPPGSSTCT
jgi:hypothetical protein